MSFELIETVTVGAGGASSIEFTSIPQDGTDLVCVVSYRSDAAGDFFAGGLQLNLTNPSSSVRLVCFGESTNGPISNAGSDIAVPGTSVTSNTFSNHSFYVSNYTSSTNKSLSSEESAENNSSAAFNSRRVIRASTYTSTTPITSLKLTGGGNYIEHSTASLYKITAS